MIPNFPKFKKLELTDKEEVEKITSKFPGYSDYNFVSLWSYNIEDDIIISILNNNLVVRFRDYITNESFYSFLGNTKVLETIETLLSQSIKEGLTPQLKLVPEHNLLTEELLNGKLSITEDKDNHDYVLSISEYSSLQTANYYKHRKLINRLYRKNPDLDIKELNLLDATDKEKLLELFFQWEKDKNKNRDETDHELKAIQRTINYAETLNLIVLGVYSNKNLVGILIADKNHSEYIESHFLKYRQNYTGINHLLHHLLAKHNQGEIKKFINIEQDLGIEGLRFAKESTRPVHYLKKYIISKIN